MPRIRDFSIVCVGAPRQDRRAGFCQRRLESLTKLIDKSTADDGASQVEPSEMSIKRALETNAQLAEAGKPGMRALDNPAMLAEPVVLLDATASDPGSHAPLPYFFFHA
ncbi:hypothetical protein MAFF301069_35840 (plasmid) [Ralstonia pseudosolanacearum]|nr:hypothetical protein MAFF241647_36770 [Ralstonia solanacearum]BEU69029.1 hypothetical protein MAFF301069_35840 [Ralstonia pseudosolanacearum]